MALSGMNLWFTAKSNGRNVSIEVRGADGMIVHGATLPMSVMPGSDVKNLTISLPPGHNIGIVAVSVHRDSREVVKDVFWVHALLEIHADGSTSNAHINLATPWVPSGRVIGQIYPDRLDAYDVEHNVHYTTSLIEAKARLWCFVADTNLLLRYLDGSATRDEMDAAAEKFEFERHEQQTIADLDAKIKARDAEIDGIRDYADRLKAELDAAIQQIAGAQKEAYDLKLAHELRMDEIRTAVRTLTHAISGQWRTSRAVRTALAVLDSALPRK